MRHPQPLVFQPQNASLPRSLTLDDHPLSPTSPELVDRAKKRRSVIYSLAAPVEPGTRVEKTKWRPLALTKTWMLLNIVVLIALAVVFEVLLKLNQDAYGWGKPHWYEEHPQFHLVWTVLPGVFVWLLIRQWVEVDRSAKMLQPYVDLFSDHVPADKSVMLNYIGRSNWFIIPDLVKHRHYTVLLTNLLCLVTISISPFSGGLFYSQVPPENVTKPISNVTVVEELGFQNPFPYGGIDAAAGFVKASSLYDLAPPPYIRFLPAAAWTSTRVSLENLGEDGTVKAHTVCLKSLVFCAKASAVSFDPSSTVISGSTSNCTFQAIASQSQGFVQSPAAFGIAAATCQSAAAPSGLDMSSVMFWSLANSSSAPLVTVCTPSIQLQRADVLLNTTSSALLLVNNQTVLLAQDLSAIDTNIAPFNGSAYNGLLFNNASTAQAQANLNSTLHSVGSAISANFHKNDTSMSNADIYTQVVADTYAHYLGLVAQNVYFKPVSGQTVDGRLHLNVEKLFVSPIATHVLSGVFLVMALAGVAILILHNRAERRLFLTAEPGTLAAAVALAGASDLSYLLNGKDTTEEMKAMLSDLHFTIDPATGRLQVEESDHGYAEMPHAYDLEHRSPRLQKAFNIPSPKRDTSGAHKSDSPGSESESFPEKLAPSEPTEVADPKGEIDLERNTNSQ